MAEGNITTYTVFYKDGSCTTGHTYNESLELFRKRHLLGVRSVAPTTPYNTEVN